jgi:hypothetical protein
VFSCDEAGIRPHALRLWYPPIMSKSAISPAKLGKAAPNRTEQIERACQLILDGHAGLTKLAKTCKDKGDAELISFALQEHMPDVQELVGWIKREAAGK